MSKSAILFIIFFIFEITWLVQPISVYRTHMVHGLILNDFEIGQKYQDRVIGNVCR